MSKELPNNYFEEHSNEKEKEKPEDKKPSKNIEHRSRAEMQNLREKMGFIARTLSENFNLKLIPGEIWATGLKDAISKDLQEHPEKNLEDYDDKQLIPDLLTYSESDLLERSEDFIFGVLRHEVGHLKHSDYRTLMESHEKAEVEGYSPFDLHSIYNSWEDGRSNALEGSSPAAKHRLGVYLKEDVSEALTINLAERPLPIQYASLCWAKGAEPFIEGFDFKELRAKISDEVVLKTYDETETALKEYLETEKGREAFYDVLWKKGWPVFKRLIDKHIEEEAKKDFDSEEQKGDQETQDSSKQGKSESSKSSGGKSGDGAQSKKSYGENKKGEDKAKPKDSSSKPEDKRNWDDLSEEDKNQYKEKARKKLNEEEKEFIQILQPKSVQIDELEDGTIEIKPVEPNSEDIKKAREEEIKERRRARQEQQNADQSREKSTKKLDETIETLKKRETGLSKNERELYNKYLSPIRKHVDFLAKKINETLPPKKETEWEAGYARGKRIDPKRLAREVPIGRGEFFMKKDIPEERNAAFTLLVDVSSSMQGENIDEALKAAILMSEALSKNDIPFEILAFHSKFLELKKFNDNYSGKEKLNILSLLDETHSNESGSTDIGYAVHNASRRLKKQLLNRSADGALIIFTDGSPNPISEHSGREWNLESIVNKWSKQIPLIGVGIGPTMEYEIKHYFGKNGLPVPDASKLPKELLKILGRQIKKFKR